MGLIKNTNRGIPVNHWSIHKNIILYLKFYFTSMNFEKRKKLDSKPFTKRLIIEFTPVNLFDIQIKWFFRL